MAKECLGSYNTGGKIWLLDIFIFWFSCDFTESIPIYGKLEYYLCEFFHSYL